jgi:hypothetical protein
MTVTDVAMIGDPVAVDEGAEASRLYSPALVVTAFTAAMVVVGL